MAKLESLIPKIFRWEGGFVDDPKDHGGATNMGVTIPTWRAVGYDKDGDGDIDVDDIRLLSRADASIVLKKYYWDRWKADRIRSQAVAELLVDWVWCSGKWGIIIPQRILKVPDDGKVGPMTLESINNANPSGLHFAITQARIQFINDIVKAHPDQARFKQGWLNRLKDFRYFT